VVFSRPSASSLPSRRLLSFALFRCREHIYPRNPRIVDERTARIVSVASVKHMHIKSRQEREMISSTVWDLSRIGFLSFSSVSH
jgi:hypothetical protein